MARPRSADSHFGRDADLEFPAVAAGLRGAVRHARPVAGLHPPAPVRSHPRISAARPPVRARLGLMDANLVRRVGFAAVAIPVALGIVWYGGLPLALLLAAAGALATRELFDLAERGQVRPARVLGMVSAVAVAPLTYATIANDDFRVLMAGAWPYAAGLWLLAVLLWALAARGPGERPLEAVAVTVLAVAYTAGLPAFLLAIRHSGFERRSWAGAWLVFFPLVVTWAVDTAAMFGGRAIGGPKLAPTVSPGKTRSGSGAGVMGGLIVAPIFAAAVFPRVGLVLPLWQMLAIAAFLVL